MQIKRMIVTTSAVTSKRTDIMGYFHVWLVATAG